MVIYLVYKCLSILVLELKGWQSPPPSWKFLRLNAALVQLDFPGICSFLQSSSDLETLVIDCYRHESRCLSILELKRWQFPPSSRKFLKLNAAVKQMDFLGICSFLHSSSDLETLVIDGCNCKQI
ncbi:hypothetical protein HAX54_015819, partial [Datura stramonium]|nr:hypothetical protein [Datura stramonium]